MADPIYWEVIPRQLTDVAQGAFMRLAASYVNGVGWLDLSKLIEDF